MYNYPYNNVRLYGVIIYQSLALLPSWEFGRVWGGETHGLTKLFRYDTGLGFLKHSRVSRNTAPPNREEKRRKKNATTISKSIDGPRNSLFFRFEGKKRLTTLLLLLLSYIFYHKCYKNKITPSPQFPSSSTPRVQETPRLFFFFWEQRMGIGGKKKGRGRGAWGCSLGEGRTDLVLRICTCTYFHAT